MVNFWLELIGWIATIFGLVFSFLTWQMTYDMVNYRFDVSNIPYLMYILAIADTSFGFFFGLKRDLLIVAIRNFQSGFVNFVCYSLYCIHYAKYQIKDSLLILMINSVILIAFNYYLFSFVSSTACGIMNIFTTCCFWVTPSQNILKMINEEDHTILPIKLNLLMIVICFLWTLYGIIENYNLIIIFPNLFGVLVGVVSAYYWRKVYLISLEKANSNKSKHDFDSNTDLTVIVANLFSPRRGPLNRQGSDVKVAGLVLGQP